MAIKRTKMPRLYPDAPDIDKYNTVDGEPVVKLYDFQTKYLEGLPAKYIFAADTGTGKTLMSLSHYDKHGYLKPLLILAPAAKVNTGDWEREVQEFFAGRIPPYYEVWSYEKFSRATSKKQYAETKSRGVWHDWLKAHPSGFAMICDEVHKAKNPQSGIGRTVFDVSRTADIFIGLSATPLPNGWIDAANYYKIFGFVRNMTEFKKTYCNIQTFKGFPEIVGYHKEDELQRFWNKIAKPLDKDMALDLPSVTSVPVRLDQGTMYKRILKERLDPSGVFLDNPSALAHALRRSVVAPKITWLNDFLDGVSDNVVVFYNYQSELEAMKDMIKQHHKGRKVYEQNGQKHEVPSRSEWPDKAARTITLAQYQSGSTGIELTYAATTVYLSPTYSYSNYEQSIGRTNRNGQKSKMTLYLLCAPNTIERGIWEALRNKSDFQESQWYAEEVEA